MCWLCFLKALSLQNRSNSNLFRSKLKLSTPDSFLCSHPSTLFSWNPSFVSKFFKILSLLFFEKKYIYISCNCFKWCPSLLQVTASELLPILSKCFIVAVFRTCFPFCDILICVCFLRLSFGVCLLRKEKGGKEVLNFVMWGFLVAKKS